MPQEPADTSDSSEAPSAPAAQPSAPEFPRFAKPQRVAFVQSAWHREVVAECRVAFLAEIEKRHIARAQIDVF